jgi:hypothetical protein
MTTSPSEQFEALREEVTLAQSRIRQHPRYKSYEVAVGAKWVRAASVSSLTGVIDKSKYLKKWAAQLQLDDDIKRFYDKLQSGEITKSMSMESMIAALTPDELAFDAYTKAAKESGLTFHSMVEGWLKSHVAGVDFAVPEEADDAMLFSFQRWTEWAAEVGLTPISVEECTFSLWGDGGWVAGRWDLLAHVNGRLSDGQKIEGLAIIDWKKGARIYDEYRLQSVALRCCFSEQFKVDPVVGIILKIDDSTGLVTIEEEVLHPVNDKQLQNVLHACHAIKRWQDKNRS